MAQAKAGDVVKVHYTGTLQNGMQFDSSKEREPLEFELGSNKVIAGFEDAVAGMEAGETKTVTIPAEKAYGPRHDQLITVVERKELEKFVQPEPGQQLELQQQEGKRLIVTVAEVTEDKVTLDANHPLAGEELTFEIELVEIV